MGMLGRAILVMLENIVGKMRGNILKGNLIMWILALIIYFENIVITWIKINVFVGLKGIDSD